MNRVEKIVIILGIILLLGLLAVSLITFSTITTSTYEVKINGISFQIPLDLVEMKDDSICAIEGVESRTFFHIWDGSFLTITVTDENKINKSHYLKYTPKKIRGIEGLYYENSPDSEFFFEFEVESKFVFELENKTVKYQTSKHNYEDIFSKIALITD